MARTLSVWQFRRRAQASSLEGKLGQQAFAGHADNGAMWSTLIPRISQRSTGWGADSPAVIGSPGSLNPCRLKRSINLADASQGLAQFNACGSIQAGPRGDLCQSPQRTLTTSIILAETALRYLHGSFHCFPLSSPRLSSLALTAHQNCPRRPRAKIITLTCRSRLLEIFFRQFHLF